MMPKKNFSSGKPSAAMQQAQARFIEAVAAHRNGQTQRALALYMLILSTQPRHIGALHFLGVLHYQNGSPERGLHLLDKAIAIYPDDPSAHSNRGNALRMLGDSLAALESYDRALQLQPDHGDALYNRGCVALELGRAAQALADFEAADRHQPDQPHILNNIGGALLALQRPQDALGYFEHALGLEGHNIEALNNKAKALLLLQRGSASIECYRAALALQPDMAELHTNLAIAHLRGGDFARGWPEFEWRLKLASARVPATSEEQFPRWLGHEPLMGKRILVQAEQQLADCVQMFRYVLLLADQGARVTFFAPLGSRGLFAAAAHGRDIVIAESISSAMKFDFETPLMSLPLAFGTTADSIELADIAYLAVDAGAARRIAPFFAEIARPRVGVCMTQEPLTQLPDVMPASVQIVGLPETVDSADSTVQSLPPGVCDPSSHIKSWPDLSAVIAELDLVCTGDGLIAHLAAALGKPVWLVLPCFADWRWMEVRDDSPWYRTIKLYRQTEPGDWTGVLQQVRQDLLQRFDGASG